MVGLDTNVVLRWLIRSDDPADEVQSAQAAEVIGRREVHIGLVVLVEVVWVLDKRYRLSRKAVLDVLRALLDVPGISMERRAVVVAAVDAYEAGGPGFSDHLLGRCHLAEACNTTLTFDKAAGRIDSFTLLT